MYFFRSAHQQTGSSIQWLPFFMKKSPNSMEPGTKARGALAAGFIPLITYVTQPILIHPPSSEQKNGLRRISLRTFDLQGNYFTDR